MVLFIKGRNRSMGGRFRAKPRGDHAPTVSNAGQSRPYPVQANPPCLSQLKYMEMDVQMLFNQSLLAPLLIKEL